MRVLVTGGHGFLGRHLVRYVGDTHDLVAPPSSELDVRDGDAVAAATSHIRPDAVVHLAYRQPDWTTNVEGSANVALACADVGARLVHLSTDVVFGDRETPWVETETPCPLHRYGRSKAAAEQLVASIAPSAVIVRTSLLYGDRDLATIQTDVTEAIAGRSPMRFFTDELRCPVHADDVARALVRLITDLAYVSGPVHIGGPETLSRAELAVRFARHLRLDETAVPTASAAELGLAESRPLRVLLDSSRARALGLTTRTIDRSLDLPPAR